MDELRVVRREDRSLIVATETGDEYRLVVDSSVLADLRHIARQASPGSRVNPREIQSLVRAGKTRPEIMQLTGADESDIERYEEPVLAERRFILTNAQAIEVRTSPNEQSEEQFGAVIAERLIGLGAKGAEWSSWRDEEAGWMIGLDFTSHDVSHHAVWSFDHRKGVLVPLTQDAVTLSKQGEVGDRLIPKLRAVDATDAKDRFDSDAFSREELSTFESDAASGEQSETSDEDREVDDDTVPAASPISAGTEAAMRAGHPSTASIPVVDPEDEFARRREIDQRAIKTPEPELQDLGQTADLLDALRRRRGARDASGEADAPGAGGHDDAHAVQPPVPLRGLESWDDAEGDDAPAGHGASTPRDLPTLTGVPAPSSASDSGASDRSDAPDRSETKTTDQAKRSKRRTSIPSWDDILFGTRSEEDPI